MMVLTLSVAAIAVWSIAATVVAVATDGYGRIPTRAD